VADRPLRADARRNREQVLAAAREAFAASGFSVPLDEIAARAGVGPGTVYRHFPTKEALFEVVITARLEDLAADLRRRLEDADPGAAFFGFLIRMRDEATAKRDMPDALAVPGALRDEFSTALAELLARAQRAGAVRDGLQVSDLIRLFKGAFASINDQSAGPPSRQATDLIFTILSDGLRPPPS
jgi:AcrR family transcriptional regulator